MTRLAIEELEVLPTRRVTASFGVAGLWPEEDWTSWMQRADRLLYQAKARGRNRVEAEIIRSHPTRLRAEPAV